MVVVSQNIIRSVLVTILLLLNFGRLFLLYCIQPRWQWYKVDLALCALSCSSFAILAGLFWSNRFPAWSQVLFWITPIFPPLQAYIRIIFQQRENPLTPRLLRFICPSFSVASTLAKIAVSLVGTFLLKSAHLGSLYILFADYLCVVAWYWWLFQQSTAGRAKLRCISCHLSAMALLLLVIAVMGTLGRSWMIALEVELVIIAIWASSLQSIP
ncbi:unnamed protein product [Penicillium nalgiovense]|nr:unnamed protein product [Penicillium nalgiovense]